MRERERERRGICQPLSFLDGIQQQTTNSIKKTFLNGKKFGSKCFLHLSLHVFVFIFFLKMGNFRPLFLYFSLFNDSWQWINIFCRWLDSNRRSLVSEATILPTKPQPRPWFVSFCQFVTYKRGIVVSESATQLWSCWFEKITVDTKNESFKFRSLLSNSLSIFLVSAQ